jgi:hypothetical protein
VPAREKDPVKVAAGRLGAFVSWSRTVDRTARTQPGRDAAWQQLLDQYDGDPKRAKSALRAHLARAQMQAYMARRKAKAAREAEAGGPDG